MIKFDLGKNGGTLTTKKKVMKIFGITVMTRVDFYHEKAVSIISMGHEYYLLGILPIYSAIWEEYLKR